MKVKLLKSVLIDGSIWPQDSVLDVSAEQGAQMIKDGKAVGVLQTGGSPIILPSDPEMNENKGKKGK